MVVVVVGILAFCQKQAPTSKEEQDPEWLNLHDSVQYVGIQTCATCHQDIYNTFRHTGMGQSFAPADTAKSILNLSQDSLIYDPHRNFYYRPFWRHDSLFVKEFRLEGRDTIYRKVQYIDYVVGSGMHTNSHIFAINEHLFQAPFTWYAQEGNLDLPPGFEGGANSRFGRAIGLECMSCHNAMPTKFVAGSENKFAELPHGIDCERCHGPGELHVKGIRAGEIVDTAQQADPRIVNPGKLPQELQFEVCQRCHLQGNPVLQSGKSFLDFKPGMKLSAVMNVYLPRYENAEDQFIMASHIDRFKQSKCFEPQGSFNCISCHNPHVTVRDTRIQSFNNTCKKCHQEASPPHLCTEEEAMLKKAGYNCVSCHMPNSTSIDIPHVTIHDHRIQIPKSDAAQKVDSSAPAQFAGLFAINNSQPTALNKARAYLQQYERFEERAYYLDSARRFLGLSAAPDSQKIQARVLLLFMEQDFAAITALQSPQLLQKLQRSSLDNAHAWTAYRIGEAAIQEQQLNVALKYYQRAVHLAPLVPQFINKYAVALSQSGKEAAARRQWQQALNELPTHRESLNNLGYSLLRSGKVQQGEALLKRAVQHYPDYEMAWLNLANAYRLQQNRPQLAYALRQALRVNPQNRQARKFYESLQEFNP